MLNRVQLSMCSGNAAGCSHAIVEKGGCAALILLRDAECAVFPLRRPEDRYLLLKHYPSDRSALRDFYKLIGKMCAKPESCKYFGTRKDEDNRMVVHSDGSEHMLQAEEAGTYAQRLHAYLAFAAAIRHTF